MYVFFLLKSFCNTYAVNGAIFKANVLEMQNPAPPVANQK